MIKAMMAYFFLFYGFAFTGCSEKTPETTYVAKATPECVEAQIKNEYVVKWKNNHYTTHTVDNLKQFQQNFINSNLNNIDYYEPNYKIKSIKQDSLNEIDSKQLKTTALSNRWALEAIHVEQAWQDGHYGQGSVVAVIDSGVDIDHTLLSKSIWINEGESGLDENGHSKETNEIDDDLNGYIDDVHGPLFFPDHSIYSSPHGTHVAGIISSQHHDQIIIDNQVQGIAPQATIMPIHFLSSTYGATTALAIEAIDYAVYNGAHIINASWGGGSCNYSLRDRIRQLAVDNVLFVSASGNEGRDVDRTPDYPSAYQGATQIVIGAIGKLLKMSTFSNYGTKIVDLFAPGVDIISTVPNDKFSIESGTSMSAPFVSGALALMKGAFPEATALELKQALMSSVTHDVHLLSKTQGYINIDQAIKSLAPVEIPSPE